MLAAAAAASAAFARSRIAQERRAANRDRRELQQQAKHRIRFLNLNYPQHLCFFFYMWCLRVVQAGSGGSEEETKAEERTGTHSRKTRTPRNDVENRRFAAELRLAALQCVLQRSAIMRLLTVLVQAIDIDDNGFITRDEFDECLKQEKFMAFFRAIKLDYRDAQLLFDLLDSDQSGKVTVDEFIDGCAKLQGEATALETKVLHLEVQMVRRQLEKLVAISGGTGSFFCTSSLAVPTIKNSPSGGNSP
ncbi:unnamed protein product [Cladocopium goreaui]|uniref:Serine/threonine-protein phosphatase PGAM5, mitochondrial (Serine/threonine-protein phosphatase Pgam5, mitochondrial) n=1 Tax=Cladocopium goreaui TaxID=2562237 RepID=A0A9P1DLP7_9DINO|nr:unnamed protein product [Cladocopium goreaui]